MFGFRYASLFKSRWNALLWAAGIVWAAGSFASDAPHHDGNDANDAAAMANESEAPSNADIAAAISEF